MNDKVEVTIEGLYNVGLPMAFDAMSRDTSEDTLGVLITMASKLLVVTKIEEVRALLAPVQARQLFFDMASCSLRLIYFRQEGEVKLSVILDNIIKLVLSKNHDYGDAWQRFGIFTPLIRINDKLLRLETLMSKVAKVEENVIDTLVDIVGYSMLATMRINWEERDLRHPHMVEGPRIKLDAETLLKSISTDDDV